MTGRTGKLACWDTFLKEVLDLFERAAGRLGQQKEDPDDGRDREAAINKTDARLQVGCVGVEEVGENEADEPGEEPVDRRRQRHELVAVAAGGNLRADDPDGRAPAEAEEDHVDKDHGNNCAAGGE